MSGLPPVYLATINTPGYVPESDPTSHGTPREAWAYLADWRECREDEADTDEPYSVTVAVLRRLAAGFDVDGDPATDDEFIGAVYGPTPGYTGDHDLGIAYVVTMVDHADYPHEAGYLVECPACEARCWCDGESAQCVYGGDHDW